MTLQTDWLLSGVPDHHWVQITYRFPQCESALAGVEYRIVSLQDSSIEFTGSLDARGMARHEGFVPGPLEIVLAPQDSVTARMAADKLQTAFQQSLDSLAMLLMSQSQLLDDMFQEHTAPDDCCYRSVLKHASFLQVTPMLADQQTMHWQEYCELASRSMKDQQNAVMAIVGCGVAGNVPAVLQALSDQGYESNEITASAFLLLSDGVLTEALETFLDTVWASLGGNVNARANLLDLVNGLLIDTLLGRDLRVQSCASVVLLLEELEAQLKELVSLFGQCKLSTQFQGRTNTHIDIEWREPPNPQRCLSHYSNVALMPVNYCGDNIAPDTDNFIDNDCVNGVTGELVLSYEDFTLKGPIPFVWRRHYRSSNPEGWSFVEDEKLQVSQQWVNYYREDGLIIAFELPPTGKYSTNVSAGLLLQRSFHSVFVLKDGSGIDRVFSGEHSVVMPVVDTVSGVKSPVKGLDIEEVIPLVQIGNQHNQHWDFHYSGGRLDRLNSSWGDTLTIKRNGADNITAIEFAVVDDVVDEVVDAELLRYQWVSGMLIVAESRTGLRWCYDYLDCLEGFRKSVISQMQSPASVSTAFQWQRDGIRWRCVEKKYIQGEFWTFEYNPGRGETQARECLAESEVLRWKYDKLGLLLNKKTGEIPSTLFTYNVNARKISCTDPEGNVTQYRYSPEGHLTAKIDAAGGGFSLGYDADGRVQEYSNALAESWCCEYDENGAVQAVTDPSGQVYRVNCVAGLPVSLSAGEHFRRYWQRDMRGNLIVDVASGKLNQASFDQYGNVLQLADRGQAVLDFSYEHQSRLSTVSAQGRSVFALSYHQSGMIERVSGVARHVCLRFDDFGRLVYWEELRGESLTLSYDDRGRLLQLVSRGRCDSDMQFHYGGCKKPDSITDHYGKTWQLRFDGCGRLVGSAVQQESGDETAWKYDGCGRQVYCSTGGHAVRTVYDALGRVTEHLTGDEMIQCTYQSGGQLEKYVSTQETVVHEYDEFGFRTKTTHSKGYFIEYRYGSPGVLSEVTINENSVLTLFRDSVGVELRRKQGASDVYSTDNSVTCYVDSLFNKKIEQTCQQLDSEYQQGLLEQLALVMQVNKIEFPPLLQREVKSLNKIYNSQRGIALMPARNAVGDGVTVFHPVDGSPLLIIFQNQVYFHGNHSSDEWTDWNGNPVDMECVDIPVSMDYVAPNNMAGSNSLRNVALFTSLSSRQDYACQ